MKKPSATTVVNKKQDEPTPKKYWIDRPIVIISISVLISVLGWFASHRLSQRRERNNRIEDIKTGYLIETYRTLADATERDPFDKEHLKPLEKALSDIQLFGDSVQVDIALNFLKRFREWANDTNKRQKPLILNINPLLDNLRNSLREKINLTPVKDSVKSFRVPQ